MVRKQVYITKNQDEKLKALAAHSGRTESEVIREAIDAIPETAQTRREAGERLISMIRERAAAYPDGGSTERWRREDSYDEPLSRFSH